VHFRNLGLLLLSFSLLYMYFNVNEYLTVAYKFQGGEKLLLDRLFRGDYAPYFWGVQVVGVLLPMLLMVAVLGPGRFRQFTVPGLGLASFLAIIGAWAKRYLIVVPTLASPFLPIQRVPEKWGHYAPTWIEWSITAAAFAAFLLLYTLLVKFFPVVSVWETRHMEPAVEEIEPVSVFGPRWGSAAPLPLILVGILLVGATLARAEEKPVAGPTTLSVTWSNLAPAAVPKMEDARTAAPSGAPWQIGVFAGGMPHFWNSEGTPTKSPEVYPVVSVAAQLKDAKGRPISYQPVKFKLKTSLGSLDFGARPTDDEGKVAVVVRDRRYGRYPVSVSYSGDGVHEPSLGETLVAFGLRPAPALPEGGVLTAPTFSPAIGLPFLCFYGSMWCVFAYALGYLVLVRMRRARQADR